MSHPFELSSHYTTSALSLSTLFLFNCPSYLRIVLPRLVSLSVGHSFWFISLPTPLLHLLTAFSLSRLASYVPRYSENSNSTYVPTLIILCPCSITATSASQLNLPTQHAPALNKAGLMAPKRHADELEVHSTTAFQTPRALAIRAESAELYTVYHGRPCTPVATGAQWRAPASFASADGGLRRLSPPPTAASALSLHSPLA